MQISSSNSAAAIQDQFLTLLTTQLRHQDPLEPTKQEDFLSQLAQFSTLEGIEELNQNLSTYLETTHNDVGRFQQIAEASGLVGKSIVYEEQATDGLKEAEGKAEAVVFQDGAVHLRVDGELIDLEQVKEVKSTE